MPLQRWLVIIGCVLIITGLLLPWLLKAGVGRLPGDFYLKKGSITFYFPIMTCLVLSIIINVIIWLLYRR